jgi:hypothetical protein
MFSASLKRVTRSSNEGNTEKFSGLVVYMLIMRMMMPSVMLKVSRISSMKVGRGIKTIARTARTPTAMKISLVMVSGNLMGRLCAAIYLTPAFRR